MWACLPQYFSSSCIGGWNLHRGCFLGEWEPTRTLSAAVRVPSAHTVSDWRAAPKVSVWLVTQHQIWGIWSQSALTTLLNFLQGRLTWTQVRIFNFDLCHSVNFPFFFLSLSVVLLSYWKSDFWFSHITIQRENPMFSYMFIGKQLFCCAQE